MVSKGVEGDRWCQITCICGSRSLSESHASTYLGEQRLFCGGRCKTEFDEHPWVYTFYVFQPGDRPPREELEMKRR